MRTLSSEHGGMLFDKVQEAIQQAGLTEKERIPKYRSVLVSKCQTPACHDKRLPVAMLQCDEASRSYRSRLPCNNKINPTQTVGGTTPFFDQIPIGFTWALWRDACAAKKTQRSNLTPH